jgi:hypothetical protein
VDPQTPRRGERGDAGGLGEPARLGQVGLQTLDRARLEQAAELVAGEMVLARGDQDAVGAEQLGRRRVGAPGPSAAAAVCSARWVRGTPLSRPVVPEV